MKRFASIACAVIFVAAFAAPASAAIHWPWHRKAVPFIGQASAAPSDLHAALDAAIHHTDADPLTAAISRLNVFASLKYIADAQKAMAIAGTADPIFTVCVQATLNVGADLDAHQLNLLPDVDLGSVDPSCALCLLAAKRKLAEDIQSGAAAARLAQQIARVREIRKTLLVGCAPLKEDEIQFFTWLPAGLAAAGLHP